MPARKALTLESFASELSEIDPKAVKMTQPYHVLMGEAADTASFFAEHWSSTIVDDVVVRPGLDRAGKKLKASTGQEILALIDLVTAAQNAVILATQAKGADDVTRGRFLLSELAATLAWAFDDGVEDDKDAQLAALGTRHGSSESLDALAAELDDYAGLAAHHQAELEEIPDFDADFIAEAKAVAARLRARPGTAKASPEGEAAMAQRNRLLGLLMQRVQLVRSAARFIYRSDPRTARKVASAFERRRRVAKRSGPSNKSPDEPAKPAPTT
ncbi:MAG: hypothetical protein U0271_43685 [Polyangiaceae bacterium]